MSKNKLDKVAEILGVKLDRKFKLKGKPDSYLLKEDGLYKYEGTKLIPVGTNFLLDILMGRYEVVTPWKPKNGESYFVPTIPRQDYIYMKQYYDDGLVCKTREEASILYDKLISHARRLKGIA